MTLDANLTTLNSQISNHPQFAKIANPADIFDFTKIMVWTPPTSGKPQSDDKEQAVDKEGSDTESAEDSNSATKVTANGVEQNGNTPKVRIFPLSSRVATDQVCFDNEDQISLLVLVDRNRFFAETPKAETAYFQKRTKTETENSA